MKKFNKIKDSPWFGPVAFFGVMFAIPLIVYLVRPYLPHREPNNTSGGKPCDENCSRRGDKPDYVYDLRGGYYE